MKRVFWSIALFSLVGLSSAACAADDDDVRAVSAGGTSASGAGTSGMGSSGTGGPPPEPTSGTGGVGGESTSGTGETGGEPTSGTGGLGGEPHSGTGGVGTGLDPEARFSISPLRPEPGDTVTVDASASADPDGTITSYTVDYGDGYVANDVVTSHQYLSRGRYTITVTVIDNEGKTGSTSKTITVGIITKEEVGAQAMPEEIAPVFAPFPTIDFKKPRFPTETVTVSLSTSGINTAAIQQAIDELSARGGGTVRIPAGEWFTGRIILKDNINLNLVDGAALRFSGEIKDYQPAVFTRYEGVEVMSLGGCIYANKAKNIAVTGQGRLIGPGKSSAVHKQVRSDTIDDYIDWDSPVSERVYDGVNSEYIFPPMFISPIQCEGVYIEGISLENTAFWNIVPIYCDNVIVRGVTIHSVGIPRGDGINMDSTKNALIEYCTFDNVKINSTKLFRAQDLVDSRFSDIEVTTDDSTISVLDAKNLLFENIDFNVSGKINLDIEGPASESIEFRSCTNIDDGVYP